MAMADEYECAHAITPWCVKVMRVMVAHRPERDKSHAEQYHVIFLTSMRVSVKIVFDMMTRVMIPESSSARAICGGSLRVI